MPFIHRNQICIPQFFTLYDQSDNQRFISCKIKLKFVLIQSGTSKEEDNVQNLFRKDEKILYLLMAKKHVKNRTKYGKIGVKRKLKM